MARAGAARREKRQAKRVLARAERGSQKYRDQKGGGIQKSLRPPRNKHGKGRGRRFDEDGPAPEEADEDADMVVVRDGKPTRPSTTPEEPDEDAELERFTEVEKKIRSLEKQKRSLGRLKERVRAGFELDAQQQTKLRSEAAIDRDLARFRSLLGKQLLAADAANGQEDDEDDDDHRDDDDEVAADDEDEEEANEGLDDDADGEAEVQDTPTGVRMDWASRDAALAARIINESDEPMSRLARQRLLKQAKREERLRLKDEKRVLMMQRKRELRLQRGRK